MNYVLYTKENCPLCEMAKNLLKSRNVQYHELMIGRDITREQVIREFPHARMAPIIMKDGQEINMKILQLTLESNDHVS
jgi:glutaredoxin